MNRVAAVLLVAAVFAGPWAGQGLAGDWSWSISFSGSNCYSSYSTGFYRPPVYYPSTYVYRSPVVYYPQVVYTSPVVVYTRPVYYSLPVVYSSPAYYGGTVSISVGRPWRPVWPTWRPRALQRRPAYRVYSPHPGSRHRR